MKRTVVIEDDLEERVDCCKSELLDNFIEYLKDNPDIDDFDEYYQQEASDQIHEIVDSNTPIYYSNIDDLYYLYSDEFEKAYRNAGCYSDPPDNYKQVTIYFYLYEQTSEFLKELEEWFDDNYRDFAWKNNAIRQSGLIKKLKEEFNNG